MDRYLLVWWSGPKDGGLFRLMAITTDFLDAKHCAGAPDEQTVITESKWLPFDVVRCFAVGKHRANLHGAEVSHG